MLVILTPLNSGGHLRQSDNNQNMKPSDGLAQLPSRTIGEPEVQRGEEFDPNSHKQTGCGVWETRADTWVS